MSSPLGAFLRQSAPAPAPSGLGSFLRSQPAPQPQPAPSGLGSFLRSQQPPKPAIPPTPKPAQPHLLQQMPYEQLVAQERDKKAAEVWPTHFDVAKSNTVGGMLHNAAAPFLYGAKVAGETIFNPALRAVRFAPGVQPAIDLVGWMRTKADEQMAANHAAFQASQAAKTPAQRAEEQRIRGVLDQYSPDGPAPAPQGPGDVGMGLTGYGVGRQAPTAPVDPRRAAAARQAEAELYSDPTASESALNRMLRGIPGVGAAFEPGINTVGAEAEEKTGIPGLGMLVDLYLGGKLTPGRIAGGVRGLAGNVAEQFGLPGGAAGRILGTKIPSLPTPKTLAEAALRQVQPDFNLDTAINWGAEEAAQDLAHTQSRAVSLARQAREQRAAAELEAARGQTLADQQAARDYRIGQLEQMGDESARAAQANPLARRGIGQLAQTEQRLADQAGARAAYQELEAQSQPTLGQFLRGRDRLRTAEEIRTEGPARAQFEDDPGVAQARSLQQGAQDALALERRNAAALAEEQALQARLQRLGQAAADEQPAPRTLEVVRQDRGPIRTITEPNQPAGPTGRFLRAEKSPTTGQWRTAEPPPKPASLGEFLRQEAPVAEAPPPEAVPELAPAPEVPRLRPEPEAGPAAPAGGTEARPVPPAPAAAPEPVAPPDPALQQAAAQKLGTVLRNASERLGFSPQAVSRKVGQFQLTSADVERVFAGQGSPEAIQSVMKAVGLSVEDGAVRWRPPADSKARTVVARNWDEATELARAQGFIPGNPLRVAPLRAGQAAAQARKGRGFLDVEQPAAGEAPPELGGLLDQLDLRNPPAAPPAELAPAPYRVAGEAVQLGGMKVARSLSMPGLVRLAREITGKAPQVSEALQELGKKIGGQVRGRYSKRGVEVNPELFADTDQARKVLGHEIGHAIDLFGGNTKKGTILAQLTTIRTGMQRVARNLSAEMRRELMDLSREWRPYDEAGASIPFKRYRESTEELVADALSVLLNNADEFKARAPKFSEAFVQHLDQQPALRQAVGNVYDWMTGTTSDIVEDLTRTFEADFLSGENYLRALRDEAKARESSWWERLRQQYRNITQEFSDVGGEFKRRAQSRENAGEQIPAELDARVTFDEGNMVANDQYLFAHRWGEGVMNPVEAAGVPQHELGKFLVWSSVRDGERARLANPHGITTHEATALLESMRAKLTPEQLAAVEKSAGEARDLLFREFERGADAGVVSRQLLEQLRGDKDSFAVFAALDALEQQVPQALRAQVGSVVRRQNGTFEGVADPATGMLMKGLAVTAHGHVNLAKLRIIDDYLARYPEELAEAARVGEGQFAPAPRGRKLMEVSRDGQRQGYHVDEYIAEAFERTPYDKLSGIVGMLTLADSEIFKPLWISWNAGFQAFNLPRDLHRTTRSLAALGVYNAKLPGNRLRTLYGYLQNWREAANYASGGRSHLLDQMLEDYAIAPSRSSSWGVLAGEESEVERLLRQHAGITSEQLDWTGKPRSRPLWKKVVTGLTDGLTWFGKFAEALPKITAYRKIGAAGVTGPQRAHYVRTFAGTPNFNIRGRFTQVSNKALIFSNIFLQGWKADLALATAPKTRGGFVLQMAKQLTPKMLMAAGAWGLFGDEIKQMYDGISEYDKTQFVCIPLGWEEGGPYGRRVAFWRMPMDETARLMGGLTWKLATAAQGKKDTESWFNDATTLVAGQLPQPGPTYKIAATWLDYLKGQNREDEFYGRPSIPTKEFEAGGRARFRGLLKWTAGQFGGPGKLAQAMVFRDDTTRPLLSDWPSMVPILDRFYRVTDYGFREQQQTDEKNATREKRRHQLAYGEITRSVQTQFYSLQKSKSRTPAQEEAYAWARDYVRGFKKLDEAVAAAELEGRTGEAQSLRDQAEREARRYDQEINRLLGRERVER